MRLSELIVHLQKLEEELGDIPECQVACGKRVRDITDIKVVFDDDGDPSLVVES